MKRKPTNRQCAAAMVTAGILAAAMPASAQTLQDALAQAYASNPALLSARALLRTVDEGVPQALAGWRPTVVINGSTGVADQRTRSQSQVFRNDNSNFFRDPSANIINRDTGLTGLSNFVSTTQRQERTFATGSIQMTQPIYRGGRTVAAVRQSENRVLSQRAKLYAEEQRVMLETSNSYIAVIRTQEEVRLNINNEQVLTRQLQATNERFRVGEITRTDVAQAESRLAGARAARAQAEGQLETSRAIFQRWVGAPPQRLTAPQPLQAPVRSAQQAQEQAANNNPVVVAALFDEAASRDAIDVQLSVLMPQISVTSQAFRNDNAALPHTRANGGQVTANLSVPLYQGGAEYSQVRQARQEAQRQRSLVAEARALAVQQAASAWETLRSTRAQVESVRAQIRAQEIALDGVQREAIVGSRTTLDVLNAEQELLNARVSLVRALADNINASYTVGSAVGRLTAQDLGLPVEFYDMRAYYNAVRSRWVGLGDYARSVASTTTR